MAKKSAKPPIKRKSSSPTKKQAALKSVKTAPVKQISSEVATKKTNLPSVLGLAKAGCELIWQNRKLLLGICLTYGLLNLILVQGLASSSNITSLKSDLQKGFSGHFDSLASSVGVLAELLGSAGNGTSDTAGAYQIFLFILVSLAIIWSLRQVVSDQQIRIRDAFYQGMTPLIPFIIVLVVFCVQLIPLVVGSALYGLAVSSGVAATLIEKLFFILVFLGFASWSFYLLCSSIFAIYIVTLPNMTPLKALRSAKSLVKKRRLLLIRKILGLPVVLVIAAGIIMLPIILVLTPLAQWVFFILTTVILLAAHSYMYTLYRELLND